MTTNPEAKDVSPLDLQVGGGHYKDMPIQPLEFCHANNIGKIEGDVIAYVSRWKKKGGLQDLEKAIHELQILVQLEKTRLDKGTVFEKVKITPVYGQRPPECPVKHGDFGTCR